MRVRGGKKTVEMSDEEFRSFSPGNTTMFS
jgi:hypothetical protein